MLVVGGLSLTLREGGLFPNQPADAEVYDPKANGWSATAPMAVYRLDQTATLLTDGRVLIAGGQDVAAFNSTETYDPTQNRWAAAAPMATGQYEHSATLLANGDVLVVGNADKHPNSPTIALTSCEIYQPRANRWSTVVNTAQVHVGQTATLLRNGRVLVVGATSQSPPELYDPARNGWSSTGASMDRYNHTATRLTDGKVVIVGGYGIDSLSSVVVYDPTGLAPVPRKPVDPLVIAAALLTALLITAGVVLSLPAVRQRRKSWRSRVSQKSGLRSKAPRGIPYVQSSPSTQGPCGVGTLSMPSPGTFGSFLR